MLRVVRLEKRDAKVAFERGKRPHDGRQRGIEQIRGAGEAARFDDPHKSLHRCELVHGGDYYFIN